MKNAYSAYKTANIDTADQGKLIIICYDVAIKHCKLSLDLFENHNQIEERTKYLYKVQDAVGELMSSLRLDVGEIAQNLYKLYEYIIRRVIEANTKNDKSPVEEILVYLETLREAWREASLQVKEDNAANENAARTKTIAISG